MIDKTRQKYYQNFTIKDFLDINNEVSRRKDLLVKRVDKIKIELNNTLNENKLYKLKNDEENIFGENNNNEFKDRIRNILDFIRGGKSLFQNLIFVFEGAGGERIINDSLIEDNYCQWFPMNYVNFYKKYIKENTTSFGY